MTKSKGSHSILSSLYSASSIAVKYKEALSGNTIPSLTYSLNRENALLLWISYSKVEYKDKPFYKKDYNIHSNKDPNFSTTKPHHGHQYTTRVFYGSCGLPHLSLMEQNSYYSWDLCLCVSVHIVELCFFSRKCVHFQHNKRLVHLKRINDQYLNL